MFTWDWACKHTVFFYSQGFTGRQAAQEDRQHRKTGSTGRQAAQEDRQHREQAAGSRQHQSILHNLFTVACSAQPQGVLSPVG